MQHDAIICKVRLNRSCRSQVAINWSWVTFLQQQLCGGFHVPQAPTHILSLAKRMGQKPRGWHMMTEINDLYWHLLTSIPWTAKSHERWKWGVRPWDGTSEDVPPLMDDDLPATASLLPWPCNSGFGCARGQHAIRLTRSWRLNSFPTYIPSSFQLGWTRWMMQVYASYYSTAMGVWSPGLHNVSIHDWIIQLQCNLAVATLVIFLLSLRNNHLKLQPPRAPQARSRVGYLRATKGWSWRGGASWMIQSRHGYGNEVLNDRFWRNANLRNLGATHLLSSLNSDSQNIWYLMLEYPWFFLDNPQKTICDLVSAPHLQYD